MWPSEVKAQALVGSGRRCCICHKFCGTNIESHHIVQEADGGESTLVNCIPLCFDCHADAGHYNVRHPKGTKYSVTELRGHRDRWFKVMADLASLEQDGASDTPVHPSEVFEGQSVQLTGFVWREAFPGAPNYTSLQDDQKEIHWMLVLPVPITLIVSSPEDDSSFSITGIKRLQMILNAAQYDQNRHLVLRNANVTGRLFPSHTGHHHGDALIEVMAIERSAE